MMRELQKANMLASQINKNSNLGKTASEISETAEDLQMEKQLTKG